MQDIKCQIWKKKGVKALQDIIFVKVLSTDLC